MHSATFQTSRLLTRTAWWAIATTSALFGLYALSSGLSQVAFLIGLGAEVKHRAMPAVFAVHALAGAATLLTGPFQFSPRIRRHRRLHRALGLTYVVGVWIASVAAIVDVPSFTVSTPARLVFVLTAAAWFGATSAALFAVRRREIARHREWMIRSFSLSLFFVTFALWVPALAALPMPEAIAYPLALALSGSVNLALAEAWIHATRPAPARMFGQPIFGGQP